MHAKGSGPVERETLMMERSGNDLLNKVLDRARGDRTQCISGGGGLMWVPGQFILLYQREGRITWAQIQKIVWWENGDALF